MATQIVLLRGLTPSGKNKVPMAPLRAALEEAGLTGVRSVIQSGNLIVQTDLSGRAVEALVHNVIQRSFGGDITVMARPAAYFRKALADNPFAAADPAKLYFTLLAKWPAPGTLEEFLAPGYAPDQIAVLGDMAYVLCATRYRDLKINNAFIERKLEVRATTRVHATIVRLLALSQAAGAAAAEHTR